jgi:hypothetical protein
MLERMIGAAKLDVKVFNEIEADQNATSQAALVVIISAISAGIGGLSAGVLGLVLGIVGALLGWVIFAALVYWIGTNYFKREGTHADWGQLARTLGFAQSPGIFRFLGIIPVIGGLISLALAIWIIVASVVAIREALDYKETSTAVIVAILAFIPYFVVAVVVTALAF